MKPNPVSLLLSLGLLIIGLGILGTASNKSKQTISSGYLDLCNLEQGSRGKVKGQIVSVRNQFSNRFTTITEGTKGCTLTLKSKLGTNTILSSPGEKIETTIKVDSTSFGSVLSESIQQPNVVSTSGEITKVNSTKIVFRHKGQLHRLKTRGGYAAGYFFSQSIAKKIKLNRTYQIYWQEESHNPTISHINPI